MVLSAFFYLMAFQPLELVRSLRAGSKLDIRMAAASRDSQRIGIRKELEQSPQLQPPP
jgi:hypothetical protein